MNLATILDLVSLAVLVVFAIYGLIRGFANTGFNLILWLAAIVLSWKLAPALATLLGNWGLTDGVSAWVAEKLSTEAIAQAAEADVLDQLSLPAFVTSWIAEHNNAQSFAMYGVSNVGDFIAAHAAALIVRAIAFLIIFILCAIVIGIVMGLIRKKHKKSQSRTLDRLLGLACGILLGAGIVMLVGLAIYYLNLAGDETKLGMAIAESKIFGFFYKNNLFVKLFGL